MTVCATPLAPENRPKRFDLIRYANVDLNALHAIRFQVDRFAMAIPLNAGVGAGTGEAFHAGMSGSNRKNERKVIESCRTLLY